MSHLQPMLPATARALADPIRDHFAAMDAAFGLDWHAHLALLHLVRSATLETPATALKVARSHVEHLIAAKARIGRWPAPSLGQQSDVADAFALQGPAREAMCYLIDAVSSAAEDRYRIHLRSCRERLTVALDQAGRVAAPANQVEEVGAAEASS